MKILIFEDNDTDLLNLKMCIYNFFNQRNVEYSVDISVDEEYILNHSLEYDLIFLDIEVNKSNGIEIGVKLRERNHDAKIMLITNYSKYLIDGYKTEAIRYFIKPIEQKDFNYELENIISNYLDTYEGFFDTKISSTKVYFNDILYVEFLNRKTCLYLQSGKVLKTLYPLKHWGNVLPHKYFAQSHKSFIVNMVHISALTKTDIIMNNEAEIPISRSFKENFRTAYMKCLIRRI